MIMVQIMVIFWWMVIVAIMRMHDAYDDDVYDDDEGGGEVEVEIGRGGGGGVCSSGEVDAVPLRWRLGVYKLCHVLILADRDDDWGTFTLQQQAAIGDALGTA